MHNKKRQPWKFAYRRDDSAANRYQALWGCSDPIVHCLRKQDHLKHVQQTWNLVGTEVEDTPEHVLVRFMAEEMPTIGSQGFTTRNAYFQRPIRKFHHIEHFVDHIARNPDALFGMLKCDVVGVSYPDTRALMRHFRRYIDVCCREREDRPIQRYDTGWRQILRIAAITQILVLPLWYALQGYRRLRDPAWFIHVRVCLAVPGSTWRSCSRTVAATVSVQLQQSGEPWKVSGRPGSSRTMCVNQNELPVRLACESGTALSTLLTLSSHRSSHAYNGLPL